MSDVLDIKALAVLSVTRPRDGAHAILALAPGRQAIWLGFAIVVLLGTILNQVHQEVTPTALDQDGNPVVLPMPVLAAGISGALMILLDFIITRLGTGLGGTGGFFDILLVDIWLRFLALGALLLDIVAYLISPALGQIVLFASYLYLLWMLINFISVAHGNLSLGKTFVAVFLSALMTMIPFIALMSLFGAAIQI